MFLTLIVFGLIITILVLFAFQKPVCGVPDEEDQWICGTPSLNPNYGEPAFEKGESLFNQNCASCHFPHKDMTGPALKGAVQRGEENAYVGWIYDFIRNEDSLVQAKDSYTLKLQNWHEDGVTWSHRSTLTNEEIDDLFRYVDPVFPY